MRSVFLVLAASLCLLSCKKESTPPGSAVEIYSLKTYQRVAGKCQVDPAASTLRDTPLIKDQDIIAYSKNDYQFTLTAPAMQSIKALGDGAPFAVTVDQQVIYYGIFKPSISSSSCENSITMDIDWGGANKITLRLAYPGVVQGSVVIDNRNDPKLLSTLKKQGKLQ